MQETLSAQWHEGYTNISRIVFNVIYWTNLKFLEYMMTEKPKKVILNLFAFIFATCFSLLCFDTQVLSASARNHPDLVKKISQSYTKKFCNSIGFGLSKESAMKFSIKENNQVFYKKKEFNNINKELLAEKIAISVVEKCGYPINLSGEKGIQEFKSYYISKEKEYS